jgi:hypothetical protein
MTAQETNLVNAFETTLDGAVASGDNSGISLADNPGVAAKVYLVFDPDNDSKREVVLWNSGAYNSMAVTRDVDAKHGTDPAHADGTKVRLAVVKQHIEDIHDRVEDIALTGNVTGTLASATQDIDTTIVLNDLADATVNVANDSIAIIDADASNATKKESIADLATAFAGSGITATSGALSNDVIGKQSIWVPATAMYPTNTGGCAAIALTETTAGRPDMYTLDFDASSDENAQFSIAFPSYWNEAAIQFQVYWTTTATDTDSVDWELAAVSVVDSGTMDVAFGTAVSVTDNVISAAEDLYVSAVSGDLTVASAAANAVTFFNIERDAGSDSMAEDAKLIGIKIFYTIDDVHEA